MTFWRIRLIRAVCDGCGDDWLQGLPEVSPVFPSATRAEACLTKDYGWSFTDEGRGFCDVCTARAECARVGHDWEDDTDEGVLEVGLQGEPLPPHRYCDRCGHHIPKAIADGTNHPERQTAPLSSEERVALLGLELSLTDGDLTGGGT